jgi:DNA gyrase/topoisomerase IV subunit A
MFDKGYYQAIRKIKSDWEGFIKILQDNKDDESSAKALAAKYAIPETDAKKLLQLTLAKMTMLGDEYVEERLK